MERFERKALRRGWRPPLAADHQRWDGEWLPEYDAAATMVQDELEGYSSADGRVSLSEYHGDRAVVQLLAAGWRPISLGRILTTVFRHTGSGIAALGAIARDLSDLPEGEEPDG